MIDTKNLTNEEIAFLLFAVEAFDYKARREHGFKPDFEKAARGVENAVHVEFRDRKLDYKQFT